MMKNFWLIVLLGLAAGAVAEEGSKAPVLDAWLARQAVLETWAAEVVQIRRLKSLVRPLEARGQVWFVQPNRFRWQLGDPPRTIAVRDGTELRIVYPALLQIEKYSLGDDLNESWQQALALLEVGFPSEPEDFYAQYELLAVTPDGERTRFELQPAGDAARRLIARVRLEIVTDSLVLLATELEFPDGSTLRNEFENPRFDTEIDAQLFVVEEGEDYEVVTPLAGR